MAVILSGFSRFAARNAVEGSAFLTLDTPEHTQPALPRETLMRFVSFSTAGGPIRPGVLFQETKTSRTGKRSGMPIKTLSAPDPRPGVWIRLPRVA